MIERIKINIKLIKTKWKIIMTILISCLAFVLYFFNIDDLINIIKHIFKVDNQLLIKLVLLLTFLIISSLFSLVLSIILILLKKSETIVKDKIVIEYGDILNINSNKKSIVVIPVNTAFDVLVDENLSDANTLVSKNTIHGNFITYVTKKISTDDLNYKIQKNLSSFKYKPIKVTNKKRGNNKIFPIGTVAIFQMDQICYYLLAISDFDNNNVAHGSKDNIIEATMSLIHKYYSNGQGYDLFIPLYGTGLSRSDMMNKYEVLKTMISIFSLYSNELIGKVHIVIFNKEKNKIPLK